MKYIWNIITLYMYITYMYNNLLLPHVIHHNSICTIPHIIHLWYEIKECTTFSYNYVPFVVNIYKILHVCVPHFLVSLSVIWLLYMCYQRMHYSYYIKLKAYFFCVPGITLFGIIVYEFWFPLNCWIFLEKNPGDIIWVVDTDLYTEYW